MEISDHGIYNLVVVARCNNNLRTGVQRFHIMAVQVIENGLQRFYRCDTCSLFSCLIRLPLMNMKFFFCCIRIFQKGDTDMIETFQCSYGGSTYGNCFSVVDNQIFNCPARNRYIFGMHLMSFDFCALYRFESSCAYVQCQFLQIYSFFF